MPKKEKLMKDFEAFVNTLKDLFGKDIHSIHVVGSVLTDDFIEGISDLNSVVVFNHLRFDFVERLADLGNTYKKKGISAPWLMDTEYIARSLDVFPLEFLNFKLNHKTIYGEDILGGLEIKKADLRLQIERELKSRLIWLRQGYLSTMGEPKGLVQYMKTMMKSLLPVLRGLCYLYTDEVPVNSAEDLFRKLSEVTGREIVPLRKAWQLRSEGSILNKQEINHLYETLYEWLSGLSREVDETIY